MPTIIPRRDYSFYPGLLRDIASALLKGKMRTGEAVRRFERAFAETVGCRFALATATGRQALDLILDALQLPPASEIILPAYTLKDLYHLIAAKGLKPVPVDVLPDSFCIDPDRAAAAITGRTGAIVACHLFGMPCDMDRLRALAEGKGIPLIEDCAHATGTAYKGKPVGALADAGFFSLAVIKPINCFGGGMLTTNNPHIARACRQRLEKLPVRAGPLLKKILQASLEQVLLRSPLFGPLVGLLARESTGQFVTRLYQRTRSLARRSDTGFADLQAMAGLAQLRLLAQRRQRREALARRFLNLLDSTIHPQHAPYPATHAWYFLVVDTGVEATRLRRLLLKEGIDVGVGAEITDDCARDPNGAPITAHLSRSAVQIPLYPRLKPYQMDRIAETLNRAVSRLRNRR